MENGNWKLETGKSEVEDRSLAAVWNWHSGFHFPISIFQFPVSIFQFPFSSF